MSNDTKGYCPECGGFIKYNKTVKLLTHPPKYQGKCKECKVIYYTPCHEVDKETK